MWLRFLAVMVLGLSVQQRGTVALAVKYYGPHDMLGTPRFMEDMQERCLNVTGSDAAFAKLKASIEDDLPKCLMTHVHVDQLKVDLGTLGSTERAMLVDKACKAVNDSTVCLLPVMNNLKQCHRGVKNMEALEETVRTLPEVIRLMCDNDGAVLLKMRQPEYQSCAMQLPTIMEDCMDLLPKSMEDLELDAYTDEHCQKFGEMRNCISRRITECGANAYVDLFNPFYRNLLALTPCK